jgi:hypothetical protein
MAVSVQEAPILRRAILKQEKSSSSILRCHTVLLTEIAQSLILQTSQMEPSTNNFIDSIT